MRLIIDLPGKVVTAIQNGEDYRYDIHTAIAQGMPYEENQKGGWIAREDMDYLDKNNVYHNHFMCEKCGFIHDFIDGHTSQYEHCPQCGTKLDFIWL